MDNNCKYGEFMSGNYCVLASNNMYPPNPGAMPIGGAAAIGGRSKPLPRPPLPLPLKPPRAFGALAGAGAAAAAAEWLLSLVL